MLASLTACDGEKDLVIIDGNLPIKTSTLYLVGDATPNGWSIDAPTPLTPTEEDPLVFTWEGALNTGEMKLCMTTGSWDAAFIRPLHAGDEIGKSGITEQSFQMHAGDPDEKWNVVDAGRYNLRFDLRNWTYSASYLGEQDAPVIEPIETDAVYIVGSASPKGWDIDNPIALEKKSAYIFVYEGELVSGELKACTSTGSWDVSFIRPASDGVKINKTGVADSNFIYTTGPDNKWNVGEPSVYRLTFDLEHWTIAAESIGEFTPAKVLYMIGEATDGGWSWDDATVIEAANAEETLFVWEGELGRGTIKAAEQKDFSAPFYRPASPNVEINENGVADHTMIFVDSPDDQWLVSVAGKYRLTFNIADMTFDAQYLDGATVLPSIYMIGEATAGGWSLDDATEVTAASEGVYMWEGVLKEGTFKACEIKDFSAPFYRPVSGNVEVSKSGVSDHAMIFTESPDDQWKVVDAGKYRLTFNTTDMTFDAQYLEDAVIIPSIYMIGDATPGGWSLDDAQEFTVVEGSDGEYTWTGNLTLGTFKACEKKDFTAPFYRPSAPDVEVSANGVAANDMVFTTGPDDQWKVVTAGRYTISLNIKQMTINVKYLD